jgi:S1-C subfamily serine protease
MLTMLTIASCATPKPPPPPPLPPVIVPVPKEVAPPADWARTLERIATSVVTIQIDQTRSFDTERNVSAQATGFVIDADRGLILTNGVPRPGA